MAFSEDDLRPLGDSGISVSPIGLGTVKFGRNTGVKYPASFELPTDTALAGLLAQAHGCGINLLDTAPAYGNSEQRLGALLHNLRDRWIVCTKTGEHFIDGRSVFDFSESGTRDSVQQSLRKLSTSYLDIVLVHCSDDDEHVLDHTAVLETLQRLKEQGDIRAFGASTKSTAGGLLALDLCDVVMVAYNIDDASQHEVLQKALTLNKGVLVKKALESGRTRDTSSALRFALNHKAISSAIVGTINPAHLRENVAAVTGP